MQQIAPAVFGAALALGAGMTPARAVSSYDQAFVDAFAAACVPERMSYEGTVRTAQREGWTEVDRTADPELAALMAASDAELAEVDDLEIDYRSRVFSKPIKTIPHYLLVGRTSTIIGEADDPLNPWVYIGCYLYNFEAAAAIDPEPVTALIGNPISNSQITMHLTSYVWGPPCPMPRTGDTWLTFIPEVSQFKEQTGFSGLVLKFDTSEPDPDETVPDTYC